MRAAFSKFVAPLIALGSAVLLTSCGTTTPTTERRLPTYETPIARNDFQHVRTTAYTHTESDHLQYTNHNALGGRLHAASAPIQRAEYVARALPADGSRAADGRPSNSSAGSLETYLAPRKKTVTKWVRTKRGRRKVVTAEYIRPTVGSAAADWSRWPAGTYFRLLSTGQIYKVDDYGWALSGRNTIDLYMATRGDMNTWGVRQEPIQMLKWGDRQDSLALLRSRQHYKHIRRMVLELQGQEAEAAALQ
ncbi:MAG: hypothetical protein H0T95_08425 [Chthoniobacterales bacterium]|nr:hypothetical protein [Chthoniobacterales bacterium]